MEKKKRQRQNQIKLMTCLYGLKVQYFLRASVLESSLQYKTDKNKQKKLIPCHSLGAQRLWRMLSPRLLYEHIFVRNRKAYGDGKYLLSRVASTRGADFR